MRFLALLVALGSCLPCRAQEASAPFPGTKSSFHGFDLYDFKLDGVACKVVAPKEAAAGKPWIWRARFFGHEPQLDKALLEKGFHVAYCDVVDLFGAPKAVARWDKFYEFLTKEKGFDKKPALEGMSRGGLIVYSWAKKNPEKVSCIYADAPVCDISDWPQSSERNWPKFLKAYGFKDDEEALAYKGYPIHGLEPLAKAKVPLLHVVGDADTTVLVAKNTAVLAERYKALGGEIEVIHKPGGGHHPHSLKDPAKLVEFVMENVKIAAE